MAIDYTLHPGETMDQYYQRTQGQTQAQALSQTAPKPMGVQATAPATPPPSNTLPATFQKYQDVNALAPIPGQAGYTANSTGAPNPPTPQAPTGLNLPNNSGGIQGPTPGGFSGNYQPPPPPPGFQVMPQGGLQPIPGYQPPATGASVGGTTGPITQPQSNFTPYTVNPQLYGQFVTGLGNLQDPNNPLNVGVNQATGNLSKLQQDYSQQIANIEGQPLGLSEQGGQEGILNRLFASQQAAAQGALTTATTNRGQQIGALATAAGLAAPQTAQVLGTFNPVTGTYGSYGGQAGGQTGIGAAEQITGQLSAGQNFYQNLVPAYSQAQSVYSGFKNFLQNTPEVNSYNFNPANFASQFLSGQFSSVTYQKLGQYLNEFLQTLTPIIGSQGVSDYKSQLVQSMVSPTASNQSIQQQIDNLMQIATGKMQATQQAASSPTPFQPNQQPAQGGSSFAGGSSSPTFGSFFGQ